MDKTIRLKSAQKIVQAHEQQRNGKGGRFGKLNPCYACAKSAGERYYSHPLTDTGGWADLALCLCAKCAKATERMHDPLDFVTYAVAHGGMTEETAAIVRSHPATPEELAEGKEQIERIFAKEAGR